MPKFNLYPEYEKKILEAYNYTNVDYKFYKPVADKVHNIGLDIPIKVSQQIIEKFIYKPYFDSVEANKNMNEFIDKIGTANSNFDASSTSPLSYRKPNGTFGGLVFSELKFPDIYDYKNKQMISMVSIPTCLFQVKQTKQIVKTSIAGRNGQIKEYTADGDYQISIKGGIFGSNGVYPYQEVQLLLAYLRLAQNIPVNCPYLNDNFGITDIIVESFEFGQNEGGISYQLFSIEALSDFQYFLTDFKRV